MRLLIFEKSELEEALLVKLIETVARMSELAIGYVDRAKKNTTFAIQQTWKVDQSAIDQAALQVKSKKVKVIQTDGTTT